MNPVIFGGLENMPDYARIKVMLFRNATGSHNYKAGDVIFKEGDPAAEMFVILEGKVEIRVGSKVIATLEQDEVFGEMSLLDDQPRCATAIATSDCQLAGINAHRFLFLITQAPHFALQILQMMAARLRNTNNSLGPT